MRVVVLVMVAGLLACGDDVSGGDAATDAPMADAGLAAPPMIPWLEDGAPPITPPMFTPCPSGWREVTDDDGTYCLPFPSDVPETCPPGQAHFAGESGCTPVGDPCPAGEWPEDLPTDGSVIYVREGAMGGLGTMAAPFGALSQVNWISTAGRTIALARGTYAGYAPLRAGTRLVGACAAETTLTGVVGPFQAVVIASADGDPAEVRNLTISNPPQMGISVDDTRRGLIVSGVVIEGATELGVFARESPLTVNGLVVRGTRAGGESDIGTGIAVVDAEATVERVIIEGGSYAGVMVNAATVTLRDLIIRDVGPEVGTLDAGNGIGAFAGATVTVERALLERNHSGALFANSFPGDAPPTITATDVVLRDTQARAADDGAGAGVWAQTGLITVSRGLISGNRDFGAGATIEGAVSLSDVIVRDTRSRADVPAQGFGVFAFAGGVVDVTRALVTRNRDIGVAVSEGGEATITDTVIRDMLPREENLRSGRGARVELGARASFTRVLVEQAREAGITSHDPGTSVTLEDVAIRDTRVRESNLNFGAGLSVGDGAHTEGTRILIERSVSDGIYSRGVDTTTVLTDLVVRDNMMNPEQDTAVGIWVSDSSALSVSRARIERVSFAAWATIVGGSSTATDLTIVDVTPRECMFSTCMVNPGGHGVVLAFDARMTVDRFTIERMALCGAFVAENSILDLANGEIAECQIGACVQSDGYDFNRLMNEVRYRDNGSPLEATMLPVPGMRDIMME